MDETGCPCGDVHEMGSAYEAVTAGLPATVIIRTRGRAWHVPRIFIAVHGLKAAELPALAVRYGFERTDG